MQSHTADDERESTSRTRRRALRTIGGAVLGVGAVGTASARSHVTEIDSPTVIDEPGTYVVTQDIESDERPAIKIIANRVTLEGNGYEIGNDVVAVDVRNVTLSDFSAVGFESAARLQNTNNCTIEQVQTEWGSVRCSGTENTIQHCSVEGDIAISISGSNNTLRETEVPYSIDVLSVSGSDNTIKNNSSMWAVDTGTLLDGDGHTLQNNGIFGAADLGVRLNGNNMRIEDNEISASEGRGISLRNANNNTVVNNEVDGYPGIGLSESTKQNKIIRNRVSGGITDEGEQNVVRSNITD